MSNRLQRLKGELKEDIAYAYHLRENLQRTITIQLQIKREITIGCQGGSLRWPVHIIMIICELLVKGTTPSAITANTQKIYAALTGSELDELPSLEYVRTCRVVVQILNDMIDACRLEKAENWHQIFTHVTTRRQIIFQNLVIGLMTNGNFESVIYLSCIFLENETSEKQVEAVTNKVRC